LAESAHATGFDPVAIARHPIYSMLFPIPIVCFTAALVTDIVYSSAPHMMWLDFSSWLILAGLIFGGFAGVLLIVELFRASEAERRGPLGLHFVLALAAWVVEVFNAFIHARDGYTAVVPTGLTLSIIAVVLSLAAGWFWQSAWHRTGDAR
jgi:uncharacterized membrane protein